MLDDEICIFYFLQKYGDFYYSVVHANSVERRALQSVMMTVFLLEDFVETSQKAKPLPRLYFPYA